MNIITIRMMPVKVSEDEFLKIYKYSIILTILARRRLASMFI